MSSPMKKADRWWMPYDYAVCKFRAIRGGLYVCKTKGMPPVYATSMQASASRCPEWPSTDVRFIVRLRNTHVEKRIFGEPIVCIETLLERLVQETQKAKWFLNRHGRMQSHQVVGAEVSSNVGKVRKQEIRFFGEHIDCESGKVIRFRPTPDSAIFAHITSLLSPFLQSSDPALIARVRVARRIEIEEEVLDMYL